MTFELLKDVSIDYCQRASDGQGQITISYQSNDDVDKILIAYLDAQRFPIGDEGSYFIRKMMERNFHSELEIRQTELFKNRLFLSVV